MKVLRPTLTLFGLLALSLEYLDAARLVETPEGDMRWEDTSIDGAAAGEHRVGAFASALFEDDHGEIYTLHLDYEYFLRNDLALAFQPLFGIYVGDVADGYLAGLDLFLKWYFARAGALAFFAEVGGGGQFAFPESFPARGSHYNFRFNIGPGARLHVTDSVDVVFGARYTHMSNAYLFHPNEGYDGLTVYSGFTVRF